MQIDTALLVVNGAYVDPLWESFWETNQFKKLHVTETLTFHKWAAPQFLPGPTGWEQVSKYVKIKSQHTESHYVSPNAILKNVQNICLVQNAMHSAVFSACITIPYLPQCTMQSKCSPSMTRTQCAHIASPAESHHEKHTEHITTRRLFLKWKMLIWWYNMITHQQLTSNKHQPSITIIKR